MINGDYLESIELLPQLKNKIMYEHETLHPHKTIPVLPMMFCPDDVCCFEEYRCVDRDNRKYPYSINAFEIEDIISIEDCQAIVVRGSDSPKLLNLIRTIFYDSDLDAYVVWAPTFYELFTELIGDASELDTRYIHYEIMKEVCDELGKLDLIQQKTFDIKYIIEKYLPNPTDEWTVSNRNWNGLPLDARLYHSLLKSIMISEDLKFNEPHHQGRYKVINAYYDLAINNMPYDIWLQKYSL